MTDSGRLVPGALSAVAFSVVLAGCAADGGVSSREETGLGPAERAATLIAGSYSGAVRDGDRADPVLLEVEVLRVAADGVFVRMEQRTGDDPARAFRLVFEPTTVTTRLGGSFSPLDSSGAPIGSCPLAVSIRSDGLVAATDASTCRFGGSDSARALIKEIAHDGQRLVIADRVVDAISREPVGVDRVLELQRVRTFTGWSGVRDDPTGDWRVSQPLRVRSDGSTHRPVDAAGVALGFSFELAPHRISVEEPPVLRLRVFDDETGQLVSQAWGDPSAGRLGVALPGLQLGLRAGER